MIAENTRDPEVERVLRNFKRTKALLCSGWQREEKLNLCDPTLSEENFKKRILNFFKEGFGKPIDLEGYFVQKFSPNMKQNPDLKLKPASIVVYGLDFMTMPRVVKYFNYFNPLDIEWLNDSSCLITFETDDIARRAIVENCLDSVRKQYFREFYFQTMDSEEINDEQLQWVELVHYYELGFERSLFARLATNQELKTFDLSKSIYLEYEDRKKMFLDLYLTQKRQRQQKLDAQRMMRRGPRQRQFRRVRVQRQQRQRNNNLSFQKRNSFDRNQNRQLSQSRLNYSFIKNPAIKQQADEDQPEEDLSVHSFVRRFQRMTLQVDKSFSQEQQSFHCTHHNQHIGNRSINKSMSKDMSKQGNMSFNLQKNNITTEVKNEQDLNLSFKKRDPREVIEISDDDDDQ